MSPYTVETGPKHAEERAVAYLAAPDSNQAEEGAVGELWTHSEDCWEVSDIFQRTDVLLFVYSTFLMIRQNTMNTMIEPC